MTNLRIGHGYDVHRLTEGRRLILGGVDVPYDRGLLGHSDADVLAHAVMDALLGAAALGDIGKLFPDSDERYAGADSLALLRRVTAYLAENGWQAVNVDATVVAQAPRLAAYIGAMRENLAAAMGLDAGCVFQANILKAALQSAVHDGAALTDDCSAVERLGKEVYLTAGWKENIKITTPEDLTVAEALLRERESGL